MIDTNVMELVLDYRKTAWRDPSSTAIPFATMPKLSGDKGKTLKEKTQRDNGQTEE